MGMSTSLCKNLIVVTRPYELGLVTRAKIRELFSPDRGRGNDGCSVRTLCLPLESPRYTFNDALRQAAPGAERKIWGMYVTSPQALISMARASLDNSPWKRVFDDCRRRAPIFVLGEASADLARGLGFQDIRIAGPTARELCVAIGREAPVGSRLVYLRGGRIRHDTAGTLTRAGIEVESLTVYGMSQNTKPGVRRLFSHLQSANQDARTGSIALVFYSLGAVEAYGAMLEAYFNANPNVCPVDHLNKFCTFNLSAMIQRAAVSLGFLCSTSPINNHEGALLDLLKVRICA